MPWNRNKLNMVSESDAKGETARIFADLKDTLGIPHVSMVFRVLASLPRFFPLFWKAARPMLQTGEFFTAADQIRADAHHRMQTRFAVPNLQSKLTEMGFTPGAQEEVKDVVELYEYVNPVLLLNLSALMEGLEHPAGPPRHGNLPAQHPSHPGRPILVDERVAPEPTRKLYDDIKQTMGTPYLNTSYITFGRWPDFLREYWNSLKPIIGSANYEEQRAALREFALNATRELPEAIHLSPADLGRAGIGEDEQNMAVQAAHFFLNLLSKQVLNIAFARVGLEGGAASALAA
ncbi:MAG TPA: halocarboxylic acid dehydrogenase DehI family protein [Candidatus Angelobacter sp.]|nr:halocarboxylic acid dehydrogenase DehI family protein [Candidatus Angelobacter sp.]